MVMGLMHVHKLENFYLCYGVKIQPRVTWGHRGQKVIFTKKMLFLLQITFYGNGPHAY